MFIRETHETNQNLTVGVAAYPLGDNMDWYIALNILVFVALLRVTAKGSIPARTFAWTNALFSC
jgi:hypothetical protein